MVEYTQWNAVVHEVYKRMAGDRAYDASASTLSSSRDIVTAITRAAARWWQDNQAEIVRLTIDGARKLAEELIRGYANSQGGFP